MGYPVSIRRAEEKDLDKLAEYILRFYRVNEEFDPLYALREGAEEAARELAKKYLADDKSVFLVAEADGRIVGIIRGEIRENPMLEASPLGVIVELYVHPSYRRKGIARTMIEEAAKELKKMGAKAVAAEFPYLNEIAVNFYRKLGFRPLTQVYIREVY